MIYNNKNTPIMRVRFRKAIPLYGIVFLLCVFLFPYQYAQGQDQIIANQDAPQPSLEEEIKGYKKNADSLTKIKKLKEAEKLYELAYKKVQNLKNLDVTIEIATGYAGFLHWRVHKSKRALKVCKIIQQLGDVNNHRQDLVHSYLLEAHILSYTTHQYYEALKIYSIIISLLNENVSGYSKMTCYQRRGILLTHIGMTKEARKDYEKALTYVPYTKKEYRYERKIKIFYGISTTFTKKDLESFQHYYNSVREYCNNDEKEYWACPHNHKNMASLYLASDNPKKAKKVIEEHIDTNEAYAKFFYSNYSCLHTLGLIYLELKEYDLAIEALQRSKEYAIKERNSSLASIILKDLSKAYQKKGDLKSSLETTRMIKPLVDSLSFRKIQKHLAKLEIQNKLKKKEEEVVELKKDSEIISTKTNRALLLTYVLSILLIIGVFLFINRIVVNKTEFYKLNEKVNHNRLLLLQSAMNPHFLFNTFGTLQHFILKKEIKKANSYMTTLSDLIRNVFASSKSIYIRFNNEIAILKSYVELELDRFDHNFEVLYDIPKELTNNNPMIPSMILQPYVENAIIHGFSEKKGDKNLTLRFIQNSSKIIQCEITDNGVGREKVEEIQQNSKAKGKRNLSIATKNTKERMRIINKKDEQYGSIVIQDLYDIEGKASGTKVIISLPVAENNTN